MKHLYAWLMALVLLTGTAHAVIYFDTDFETCVVGSGNDFPCEGWNDFGIEFIDAPNHNKIEITNTLAFSGSKSVKTTLVNNTQAVGCGLESPSLYHSSPASDHLFTRFAVRKSPGFVGSTINLTKFIRWPSSAGYPVLSVWQNGQNYQIAVEGGWTMGSTNYVGGPPVSSTAWDQVETEFKYNTPGQSDGLVRLWVNGTLYIERLNLQLRGPTPTSVLGGGQPNPSTAQLATTQIFVQCGLGNMWWDRVAAGNTRIGTTGPVIPTDTSPPLAPTNLVASASTRTLTWTAGSDPVQPSSGYAGVHIFRCVRNPADCTATTQIATVSAPAVSYVDPGCSPGFTCDYRIRSFDGAGLTSVFTAEVSLAVEAVNRRVLFTDTFIRADNADIGAVYDGGYTTGNNFKIASNRLAPSVAGVRNFESYNVAVPNDQFGSLLLSDGVTANDSAYVLLRMPAPPTWNGYECGLILSDSGRLQRIDAGVGTVLNINPVSPPFTTGDRIRGEAQGSTIRCYIVRTNAQGVQSESLFASATDSTYASGRVGFRIAPNIALPSLRVSEVLIGDFTNSVNSSIIHDSTSTSALANTTNSLSWSHTVANLENRLLSVCVQTRNANTAATVTNVTANGTSLAKFRDDTRTVGTDNYHTSLWRQVNPNSGTNTITSTFSAAPTVYGVGSSSSFSGVEQVAPVDAVGGANGVGTSVSIPVTTTVTGTLAIDCVLGQDAMSSAGGGQTILRNSTTTASNDGVASSAKPLTSAGASTTTWVHTAANSWVGSVMAIKPAQINNVQRPKVLNGTVTSTGATGLIYDAVTPTALKVIHGPNSGIGVQEVNVPIANVPGGVLTLPWCAGCEFAQILAVDAFGETNKTNQEYLARSLVGIAPATSDDPVVMTNPQPSTELPAGTPSANITMTVDQVQISRECRWSDTDQAYASMPTANQMVINGTLASGTKTGLSNGNNYTVYRTCITLDSGGTLIAESPTRSSSTFSVASSTGDTTPPGNVSNVVCLANGTQADCTHSSATDAVSYEAYISSDAGVTYILASTYAAPTVSFSLLGLSPQQTYSVKVLARDVVGNPSAADSNISTFVMPVLTDVTPPGDVPFLQIVPFTNSVLASFSAGVDAVDTTILGCAGSGCAPGEISKNASFSPILIEGLIPGTVYRWTAIHHDAAGNASVNRYPNIEITTTSLGLSRPRTGLRFGADRSGASGRSNAGTRPTKDPCGE